jgi:glutamate racemase
LIKNEINDFFKGKVKIFDSAEVVAARLKWILEKEKIVADKKTHDDVFYVSDYTESFEQSTRIFFKKKIQLEKMDLWNI